MGAVRASVTGPCGALLLGCLCMLAPRARAQGVEALQAPRPEPSPAVPSPAAPSSVDSEPRESELQPAYEAEWVAVAAPALVSVDPVIAQPLGRELERVAVDLGYRVRAAAQVTAAEARVAMGRIASPGELWRLAYASGSQASMQARVFAQAGTYVIELTVALLDGRGPFVVRARTDHLAFLQTLETLVREALPAAGTGSSFAASPTAPARPPSGLPSAAFEPDRSARARTGPPPRRLGLALVTDSAVGFGTRPFYNHLLGARLDVRLSHEVVLGAYLGYANLVGYQGRVSNWVSYAQIEERIRVSDRHKLRVPLRFAAGFVPRNGALLRMAAGIARPVSDRFEWGIDLLAPTIWFLPEGKLVTSLNFAFEVIFNP